MKTFKEFEQDPTIRGLALSLHSEMLRECQQKLIQVSQIKRWPYAYTSHSQQNVQYAVYHSQWSREWQIFRIALKGLTTRQKLFQLIKRWKETETVMRQTGNSEYYRTRVVQIENYVGALVRGGLLDEQAQVCD